MSKQYSDKASDSQTSDPGAVSNGVASEEHHSRFSPTGKLYLAPNHDLVNSTIQVKSFTWPQLFAGDCNQLNGVLNLNSDGTAHFHCVVFTKTTHSGDYWWTGFELLDVGGVSRFSIPFHQGPRMDDGDPPPRYNFDFDFTYDASLFDIIQTVRQGYKC